MYKLLNRFAWLISLGMGYLITFFMFMGFDELDGRYSTALDDDMFFVWIFFILLFGSFFKKIFLSKNFILDRVHYFKNTIINHRQGEKQLQTNNKDVVVPVEESETSDKSHTEFISVSQEMDFDVKSNKTLKQVQNDKHIDNKSLSTTTFDFASELKESVKEKLSPKSPKNFQIIKTIKGFFAENLMAKVGGILLFLGALFLLQLVYTAIGNVGKLVVGFLFGFVLIGVGIFLDKKKFVGESRIVLGIGFLVNYLVILSGRYLLGTDVSPFLSEGLTFVLLVLNTIFAVVTSFVYKSNTLLIFSFIFAYLNPFLVGGSSDNPYTLSIYSMVVSLGALFLSLKLKQESVGKILLVGSFILGNLLFLVAPFSTELQWIVKVGFMLVLGIIGFYFAYKRKNKLELTLLSVASYLFIILNVIYGALTMSLIFENIQGLVVLIISVLFLFVITILSIISVSISGLVLLFVFPFLLLYGLTQFGILNIVYLLPLFLFMFVVSFAFIGTKIVGILKYVSWGIIGIILTLFTFSLPEVNLSYNQGFVVMITALIMLFATYFLSIKKDNEYLYSIGSLFSAILLAMVMQTHGELLIPSIVAIVVYFIANVSLPLISKNLIKSNLQNISFAIVIGILFVGFSIYSFGQDYFPGISLGFAFLVLSLVYFIISYLLFVKLKQELGDEKTKEQAKNVVYSVLAGSISFLSIAVSYIFSKYGEVVATTWLLESVVLLYFYSKQKDTKIYVGAIILFLIGLIKFQYSIDTLHRGDFTSLIPLAIILIIMLVGSKFMEKSEKNKEILYDILHIITIFLLGIGISKIFMFHYHGFGFLSVSILTAGLLYYYSKLNLKYLLKIFSAVFILVLIIHGVIIEDIMYHVMYDGLSQYKIFQYIATAILGAGLCFASKTKKLSFILYVAFILYLLMITSYYIYDLSNNTFAITIYWGVLSAIALIKGIDKNIIRFRTIGLYLLILTVGKIVLFDIWYSLDNAIVRVLALMIVGALMIYISTLYSKKYGGNLKGELDVKNLR